jgi:hypothetical protein
MDSSPRWAKRSPRRSYSSALRDESLNGQVFFDLADAQRKRIAHPRSLLRRRDTSPSPSGILIRQIQNRVKGPLTPGKNRPPDRASDLPSEPKMRTKGSPERLRLLATIN